MAVTTRWALALLMMLAFGGANAVVAKAADPLDAIKLALRTRDYSSALARLQQAADAGNAQAQLLLGLMDLNGVGTQVDQTAAENWLTKSAAQGNATACYVLAALYA